MVEGEEVLNKVAEYMCALTDRLGLPYIFKSSYKKANRTSLDSFTGIGDEKALNLLAKVREQFKVPVLTDVHSPEEARLAAQYVDVLQIPAFLCRQTELLVAAAETGKIVNIKKGQFLSAESIKFALAKVKRSGNDQVMLTERGTTFGYNDLIMDPRSITIMKQHGVPVVVDCTHSIQRPNTTAGVTGGMPEMIETIAKTGVVLGADGLFMETHPRPQEALSDGANMLPLERMDEILGRLLKIRRAIL